MSRETSTRRQFLRLGGLTLAAGLAGCAATSPQSGSESSDTETATSTPSASPSTATRRSRSVYTTLYRDTISSVVLVKRERSQGTGFLVDDTHVVTNAHVVGAVSETQLRFHDGAWSTGRVVGTDPHSDLAVIEAENVPASVEPLSFSDQRPVIGQRVAAIGNPYNLNGTLTAGLVSGTDRLIPAPTGYRIPDAIQTDAAVNPGNSGGPLMTLDGAVLGVVNSKRGDNIAFGISAALSQQVVRQLIDTGEYHHAFLGASFETVTPTIAEAMDMDTARGLLVVRVLQDGPAAGVLEPSELAVVDGERIYAGGDVVLAVDGTEVESFEDLASYLALQTRPGDTVEVRLVRDGREQTVTVELGRRPERGRSPFR